MHQRAAGACGILQAVSQENVELVRRALAAVMRRPKPDFATVNALFHPEHEQIPMASRVEGESRLRGARGFREWLDSFSETFEWWEGSLEEVRDIRDDRVLVVGVFKAVGKRGRVPVEARFAQVVTVRDGKVTRTESFSSPEEALEAVGLQD
jgi:ketosteroid isomerase-like protein